MFKFFKRKPKNENPVETPAAAVVEPEEPVVEELDETTRAIVENSALQFIRESYTDGLTHDKIKILSITKIDDTNN